VLIGGRIQGSRVRDIEGKMNDSFREPRFQFSTKALLLLTAVCSVYAMLFIAYNPLIMYSRPSLAALLHVWMLILVLHVAISFYAHPRPGAGTIFALLLAGFVCCFPAVYIAHTADYRTALWHFLFLLAHAAILIRSIGLSMKGCHVASAYLFVVVMGSFLVMAVLADS
jgi:hypothetical protein